jgi:hypothetical protein
LWISNMVYRYLPNNKLKEPSDTANLQLCYTFVDQVPGAPVLALVNGLRCSRKSLNSPSEFLVGRWPSAARICLPTCMMISVRRSSETFSPGGSLFFSASTRCLPLIAKLLNFDHAQLLSGLLAFIDLLPLFVPLLQISIM